MSRAGYHEDGSEWDLIRWRGAVTSAIRGKRGQAFLREMLAALDALPEKKLITGALVFDGQADWDTEVIVGADRLVMGDGHPVQIGDVCAMGAVVRARGQDVSQIDPYCAEDVAGIMGVADALAREIAYINDEEGPHRESPEQRFQRVRRWVEAKIYKEVT